MSKYIDMITQANKTLTAKYDSISKENEELDELVTQLRKENSKLKEEVYNLKRNQCKNNHMCDTFSKEVKGIMQFANIFKLQKGDDIITKKFTYEYVKNYIEGENGNGCKLISKEYNKINEKLKIQCKCGKFFNVSFNTFKNQNQKQCIDCGHKIASNKTSLSYEEIVSYINGDEGNGCRLDMTKEEFEEEKKKQKKSSRFVKLKIICGCEEHNIFYKNFDSFVDKKHFHKQCPKCGEKLRHEKRKRTNFDYEIGEINKRNKYKVIDIERAKKKNKNYIYFYLQDMEGYKYKLTLGNVTQYLKSQIHQFKMFDRCNPFTIENIKLWLKYNEPEYQLLSSKYYGNGSITNKEKIRYKLLWQCSDNHIFQASLTNFKDNGSRCPICNISKGEKRVQLFLMNYNIYYEFQKEYVGLIGLNGGNLSYDFYIPLYNLLIEYQGEQHEKFTPGIHESKKDFEKQQEHDKRKKDYAEKNNINLLEIWYWDFENIEKILTKELKII